MATQVQFRGGTTSEHSTFTGVSREVTVDTTKKTVVVHDGSTAGGIPLAKESAVTSAAAITGGSINGTTVGASTASTGRFTTVTATGLTSGRVTYAGASGLLSDSANLTTDGTNLSLGAATSNYRLNIKGGGSAGDSSVYAQFTTLDTGTTSGDGLIIGLGVGSSPIAHIQQLENAPLAFSVNGSERMRITGAGNVGIGTSSPNASYLLDVAGKIRVVPSSGNAELSIRSPSGSSNYVAFSEASVADRGVIGFANGSGALQFRMGAYDMSTGTQSMTLDSSGNLGLGVTPATWDSSFTVFQVRNGSVASTNGEIGVAFNKRYASGDKYIANGYASQYIQTNGAHSWFNAPSGTAGNNISFTQAMTLDSSGRLGIGTSSPNQKLTLGSSDGTQALSFVTTAYLGDNVLIGNIEFSTNSASGGYDNLANIQAYKTGTNTNSGDLTFLTKDNGSSAVRMRIASGGVVTMSSYGAGAATFSASGVISSVSDETWKTKDGVPTNTDAMLQKLEPGYWFYNEEKAPIFGEERQLGFYAQNVHEAIGEEAAPTPEEGKPWGYHDRSVLAIAVMSLKNALNTIEELKQRIETLENK